MTLPDEPELRYGIDRLLMGGKRLFGWGWIAHRRRAVESLTLVLADPGGEQRLPVTYGLGRDDVQDVCPTLVNAGASGFVVTGYVERVPAESARLAVRYTDGGDETIDVTVTLDAGTRPLEARDVVGEVIDATGRETAQRVSLVFDHDMGGGANLYRNALVAERLAAGCTVVLCTYSLPTLDYRLRVHRPGHDEVGWRIDSFLVLERLLRERSIDEVFVNSPVSFDEPLVFVEWVAAMRAQHPAMRLVVAVHDYFPVCPSFVLLNADGRYCGIPDASICDDCLARHRASYVMLSPPAKIGPWRAPWRRCLYAADEVRCFSDSSRALLLRAYPDLDRARITVIPHRVDFAPSRAPALDHRVPLVIGVVGHISPQKGAAIVRTIVERLDREHDDARVVVIGTLDAAPASPRLTVTGPYAREDLGTLIEANRVNMVLIPSICPETFSYATEEMMRLAMPIVAFELGAPAERLARYARGRVCPEITADAALGVIRDYHSELARKPVAFATRR